MFVLVGFPLSFFDILMLFGSLFILFSHLDIWLVCLFLDFDYDDLVVMLLINCNINNNMCGLCCLAFRFIFCYVRIESC